MVDILPLVQTAKLVTPQGNYTVQFKLYLDSIQQRIGGVTGGIYNSLAVNAGAVTWDLNASPIASLVLVSGANVLTVINQVAGFIFPYRLTVIQPSSGAAGTITWPRPPMVFPGGTAPTLSTGHNAVDFLEFVSDGNNMYQTVSGLNYS